MTMTIVSVAVVSTAIGFFLGHLQAAWMNRKSHR